MYRKIVLHVLSLDLTDSKQEENTINQYISKNSSVRVFNNKGKVNKFSHADKTVLRRKIILPF